MAIQGALPVDCELVFPFGCGVVSAVTPINDYDLSTKDNPVQERDKNTGVLMWQVDVIDFDPEARERTFKVKVVAEHQPVPPDAIPGTPLRPVRLDGLSVTPWVKEPTTPKGRPKVAFSLRCAGLSTPKHGASRTDANKSDGRAA